MGKKKGEKEGLHFLQAVRQLDIHLHPDHTSLAASKPEDETMYTYLGGQETTE